MVVKDDPSGEMEHHLDNLSLGAEDMKLFYVVLRTILTNPLN